MIARYDLGKFESMAPLKGGQANSSVKIKTREGVFTLSVCDEKNQEEIRCLTRVLTYLETKRFPATRLLTTKDNKAFITHEGKPVYIKEFLEGRVCPRLLPGMHYQAGEMMARLHALEPPPGLPGQFPYGLNAFEEIFNTGGFHPYVDWLKEKKQFLETKIDPAMAKGFIHGDFFWDNLLFSGDTLAAVLDFEEACTYYKLFDIGMGLVGCCGPGNLFSMDRINEFMSGYSQVSPLTDAEKKQFKIFVEYAAVAASFWRFRQYHIRYPSPDKKNNYKELSRLADQIHSMDGSLFKFL